MAGMHGRFESDVGQTSPRITLFLARGRDKRKARAASRRGRKGFRGSGLNRINRYGARAFSTLGGYASRNRETELAFHHERRWKRATTVPVLV